MASDLGPGTVTQAEAYAATKPEYVDDPSVVNRTRMYPADDVTGPGTVEPLNGLPGSSVINEQDDDAHEYTLTRSLPDSVRKLVNVSVSAVPGVDMVT